MFSGETFYIVENITNYLSQKEYVKAFWYSIKTSLFSFSGLHDVHNMIDLRNHNKW